MLINKTKACELVAPTFDKEATVLLTSQTDHQWHTTGTSSSKIHRLKPHEVHDLSKKSHSINFMPKSVISIINSKLKIHHFRSSASHGH